MSCIVLIVFSEITYLLRKLQSEGYNSTKLWEDIKYAIVMSILSGEQIMTTEYMNLIVNNR
jgi:hypothetical protein